MTKSLPCSEPLPRLVSLAIAHGWGWCHLGGSQSWVSNRPLRTSCVLRVQDGAPIRQRRSGHHVHELRVRDGVLVRQGRSRAMSAGWGRRSGEAGQAVMCMS